jgi:TRAP-type C4-dicarboxylate transport system permease small subunit
MFVMVNVILRRFFNSPIYGSTEFIRYISLLSASLAIAENEWVEGNAKMSLLLEKLPKKYADTLIFISGAICSAVFILVTYLLFVQAVDKFAKVDITPELNFPVWIPAIVLAIGFCILTVTIIIKTVILGHALKSGETIYFERLKKADPGEGGGE